MVDPRHPAGHDDGTHPARPSVGGPTPDPRLGNPPAVKRRNRWSIGIAIAALVAAAAIFLIWYWTTGAVNVAAVTPAAPPVAASASPAAEKARAQPGDCRPFTKDVDLGGQRQTLRGTACMQPDGSWRIIAAD